jgi:Zn-dependent protease with chaperone function
VAALVGIQNISRYLEKEADYFVFLKMKNHSSHIKVLKKTASENMAEYYPNDIYEMLFSPNNSVEKRIAHITDWKAAVDIEIEYSELYSYFSTHILPDLSSE